ncbi:MAG: hypothetical protein OEV60_10615 [Actinomycetota bacterium]|nr:hypothetical protein [Actinomycetota bacterium]
MSDRIVRSVAARQPRPSLRVPERRLQACRRFAGTRVVMLVAGLDVRIVSEDGELLRELVLDPTKGYQALGRP